VTIATDPLALRECQLILSATNAPRPVIKPEHVGDGQVVIADVAAPRDVDPSVAAARPHAHILKGGIVHLPGDQVLDLGGVGLRRGQIYGCLAETLILGLERTRDHFSYGPLDATKVRSIADAARRHGFVIAES
jgi:predicted amino acid dehydrogenase